MKKVIFLVLIGVGLFISSAEAQRKAGRNGATFLEVGVGAREVGIGSAATTFTNDANQIFWNPAGTALLSSQTVSAEFSYNQWIADLKYSAAAVGYNLKNYGTVTVGFQMFGLNNIPADRQNGYADAYLQSLVTDHVTSSTFDYQDLAMSVNYSKYVINRLSLGATVKYIHEKIDNVSGSAVAFDFGSVYHIGILGWKIGARLNNIGSSIKFYNQSNPLPLTFAIGTSLYPYSSDTFRWMIAADAVKQQDTQQLIFAGTQVSFYDLIFLRGGYKFNYSGTTDGGTSLRPAVDTTIEGISFGASIQYNISGYNVGVDYTYTQMDLLKNVNRISLRINF